MKIWGKTQKPKKSLPNPTVAGGRRTISKDFFHVGAATFSLRNCTDCSVVTQ